MSNPSKDEMKWIMECLGIPEVPKNDNRILFKEKLEPSELDDLRKENEDLKRQLAELKPKTDEEEILP